MSKFFRTLAVIPMASNTPEDVVVNTWYHDGESSGDADVVAAAEAHTQLRTFYGAVAGVLFPVNIAGTLTLKTYDMATPEPRFPILEDTAALAGASGNPLPAEVAVCLSYTTGIESGLPRGRRRGRVFLGPCRTTACDSEGRVATAVRNAIRDAAQALEAAGIASNTRWAGFSPTTLASLGGTLDSAFRDVLSGWVDNAFDTQRRRGLVATARSTWS